MISVIIPAYNEEKRLVNSLEKLADFLKKRTEKFEVVVVDDASTDKTSQVAKQFKNRISNLKIVRLEKSPFEGKGLAVNKGVLAANGDVALFTDADFSTPISEIDKLLVKLLNGSDVAIGSRAIDRSLVKESQNPLRELMGRAFNFLVQLVVLPGIKDTQCGFKAFKMPASKKIFETQKVFDFGFDIEILYLARKKGLRITEVPVLWYNHPESKVHPVRDSISMFLDIFRVRLYHADKNGSLLDKVFYLAWKNKTIMRFAIVGATGTVVDYSLFFILTRAFALPVLVANPISVEAAIIWNFTWNNIWTFSQRTVPKPLWKKFVIFQFVSLGGLLLSQNSLFIFNKLLNIFDLLAKALTIPLVAAFNYLVNSRWTFRDVSRGKSLWYLYILLIIALGMLYTYLTKTA